MEPNATESLIERSFTPDHASSVSSVTELLAQVSPQYWLVTVLLLVVSYGLTWLIRRWIRVREVSRNTPNWLNVDAFAWILFPLLLWLFSHMVLQFYEYLNAPVI